MQREMPPKYPKGVAVAVADTTFFLGMHLLLICRTFLASLDNIELSVRLVPCVMGQAYLFPSVFLGLAL